MFRYANGVLVRHLPERISPSPADLVRRQLSLKTQASLVLRAPPPPMRQNKEEDSETRTSGPACDLLLISEFCVENTSLGTENIRLKKRQRGRG